MEDLDDWVPAFSGYKTLSVDSYFQMLYSYCDFHDLDARKDLLLAQHRCVGTAAAILSGKSFTSTSHLRSALEDAFGPSEEDASKSFCQVKQDCLEPVVAYADRLRLAFQRTPVSGATHSLKPHLQQQMLSLAPASFEEAPAKAKIVEADLYHLASAVAPAWSASSQDPAVSAPRRRQRSHQQAQPAQASPETTPVSSVPEPQLSYEALGFSTELLRTTEALQDLLQSTAVSQGSPVAGDPGVAAASSSTSAYYNFDPLL